MARKDESNSPGGSRASHDLTGLLLVVGAFVLLVALFSYDRNDLAINHVPPNEPKRNWIGPIGAWLGYGLFFGLGAGGYLVPILLLGWGLAFFTESLSHLRRSWPWALVLCLACAGLLDIYGSAFSSLKANMDSGSAGGVAGLLLNKYVFSWFGTIGAPIMLATLYLLSLLYLTDLQLFEWIRRMWMTWQASGKKSRKAAEVEVAVLEKRARELEEEAKRLQESEVVGESAPTLRPGLGPDGQPVPEPLVRDLSVPVPRIGTAAPLKAAPVSAPMTSESTYAPTETPEPGQNADVGNPARERTFPAATSEAVLGRDVECGRPANDDASVERSPEPAGDVGKREGKVSDAASAISTPGPSSGAPSDDSNSSLPMPRKRPAARKPKPLSVAATPMIGNYQLPPMDLLHAPDPNIKPTESKDELVANARLMQQTLAQFDIDVSLGDITKGPTITRYELHPAPGVKLERITGLTNNIAAALKAERIHILAPVPGKSSVGVEVPNAVKTKVIMRDLLEADEWRHAKARIPLALGKDVYGHPIVADLAEMPHLLIAGSTGSGKSVCINAIIASLLYRFPPDQLRFVMIDPKVVELQQYNALPHLVVPVVNDPKKVILALRWVVNEMEKRYQIFAKVGVRNIRAFNERPRNKPLPQRDPELPLVSKREKIEASSDGFAVELDEEIVVPREDDIVIPEKLSYIVVIIDELADLMLVAPADVEMAIARITQMARAAGIHCIVATQRPSVDVITGVIKANIPARIAFQVAAKVDSRTILDAMGADKLLGKGDMLYLPPGSAKLTRAQGALITDQEIQGIVDWITRQGKPSYEVDIHQQLAKPSSGLDEDDSGIDEDEDLIQQCIEVIRSEQKASVSLLQRRLRLGYTRAARIMDELEERGIVGPSRGAEPRDILIDLDAAGADGRPRSENES